MEFYCGDPGVEFSSLPFSFNASLAIFSSIMLFFLATQAHTGRIYTGPRFISVHKTPGPATSSMVQRAQLSGGSKPVRLATIWTGSEGHQCVSFSLSHGHTAYQRVSTTVADRPVTVMFLSQDVPEDHRTLPIWWSQILSILHPTSY